MPCTGWKRLFEKPDVTRGLNGSGDSEKLPLQRPALLVVEARLAVGARRTESPSTGGVPTVSTAALTSPYPTNSPSRVARSNSTSACVAALQIGVEVDLAAEDLGQPQRQLDVLALGVERFNERRCARAENATPTASRSYSFGTGTTVDVERGRDVSGPVVKYHAQQIVSVDVVAELTEQAVESARDRVRAGRPGDRAG